MVELGTEIHALIPNVLTGRRHLGGEEAVGRQGQARDLEGGSVGFGRKDGRGREAMEDRRLMLFLILSQLPLFGWLDANINCIIYSRESCLPGVFELYIEEEHPK